MIPDGCPFQAEAGKCAAPIVTAVCSDGHDSSADQVVAAVAERLLPRLMAALRPGLEAELHAAVVDDLRRAVDDLRGELHPQLSAELDEYRLALTDLAAKHRIALGDRAVEQARDVIVRRIQEERRLWRELDRNAPPKRRWWQRREQPTPKSMTGVG